jgi:cellulose synthase/poly-beta-1,6-N-acetylglucosamine synthase-like glycosyltransferase
MVESWPSDDEGKISSRGQIRQLLKSSPRHHLGTRKVKRPSSELRYENQVYPYVVVLIPAHNEVERIGAAIKGVKKQGRKVDEIIVVADNCTDDTVKIALAHGVSVIETYKNKSMKAGALNGVLRELLPLMQETDAILVMDADTVISREFVSTALETLFQPRSMMDIGGVGGIFLADKQPWSVVHQLQANEYTRYARRIGRRRGRAMVLTGTGTLFNVKTLREVARARALGRLPGDPKTSYVYDTEALTEDNELTLSAKELGFRVISPKYCTVETAMMPTWNELYRQRRRWQRGAMENLLAHGLSTVTIPYFIRQVITYIGAWFVLLYIFTVSVANSRPDGIDWDNPKWLAVMAIYVIEQSIAVRKGGAKAVFMSLLIVPELVFNLFLNLTYIVCLHSTIFATKETWGRTRDLSPEARRHNLIKEAAANDLHRNRTGFLSRILQIQLEIIILGITAGLAFIPFWNLHLAWGLVSGFVLLGTIATLVRLIPVKQY